MDLSTNVATLLTVSSSSIDIGTKRTSPKSSMTSHNPLVSFLYLASFGSFPMCSTI